MFEISTFTSERWLEYEGIPVIRLTADIPVVSGGRKRASRRINAFYGHLTDAVEKHLERHILKHASAEFGNALEQSRHFEPYRIKMTFESQQKDDENTLEVSRRLYFRARGIIENECILTEKWNTLTGMPDKLSSKAADYSFLVK